MKQEQWQESLGKDTRHDNDYPFNVPYSSTMKKQTRTYLGYCQLLCHPKYKEAWAKSAANEFGHLAQGLKDGPFKAMDTITFISKNRGTLTVDMTLFKILVNSVVSTPGAKCFKMDIKDFYLNAPMKQPEYMHLKISEIIAQELLEKRLVEYAYHQSCIINGLWTHKTRPICFCLCINDFAVKYTRQEDTDNLISAIRKYYPMTVDMDATKYIGLTIKWDYENRRAHIHMPGYLQKAFTQLKHKMLTRIQNSSHPHAITCYGAKTQYIEEEDTSPPLSKEDMKFVQAVVTGTMLYYVRAIDVTNLPTLSSIATEQTKPMQ